MRPERVRFGILGCADIARRRTIPAMLREPGAELVAVASRSAATAREFTTLFGNEAVEGYGSLVERTDIDALYIPLPAGLHHEWILRALNAGKHVLAEKPLTTNYQDTVEAVEIARSRGLTLMENLTYTYHGMHATVRELVATGTVGELRTVSAAFAIPPLRDGDIRYRPELGGGSLADNGIYPLSAALLHLGPELDVVGAALKRAAQHSVDVAGNALLSTPSGQTATVTFGFEHSYLCQYVLWGSEGRVVVDRAYTPPPTLRPTIRVEQQDTTWERTLAAEDQFAHCLRAFVRSVAGTAPDLPGTATADLLRRARLMDRVRSRARILSATPEHRSRTPPSAGHGRRSE
ncbi:NDP-hexose-3-ketoreductase [Lipingzhangella halophila]|uniref:NDP-hexose-3-ketoreductase n=1 Tax=Lipingzhangella halophila TaxID=1783352 RepID=A0A7W7RL98_9ACTN|nr:Gfo/Idh/MocA family oxidoreductase [Lipingzhangella halophila]MBB4934075.1 NDP-hexose-3-ketoreductase [Lipingzhangella halophila]